MVRINNSDSVTQNWTVKRRYATVEYRRVAVTNFTCCFGHLLLLSQVTLPSWFCFGKTGKSYNSLNEHKHVCRPVFISIQHFSIWNYDKTWTMFLTFKIKRLKVKKTNILLSVHFYYTFNQCCLLNYTKFYVIHFHGFFEHIHWRINLNGRTF